MGSILGKFRNQEKDNTFDVLEKLDIEITAIEEFGKDTELKQKRIVGRFFIGAILFYISIATFFYFYYYIYSYKITTNERLYGLGSLVALVPIIWIIKRILTSYYSRQIKQNQKKLISLKKEKKKILDNVMETETYKVAKKILDKFGSEPVRKPSLSTPISQSSLTLFSARPGTSPGLRQRIVPPSTVRSRPSFGGPVTPYNASMTVRNPPRSIAPYPALPGSPLPMPRSILPQNRSVLDKMVDYLVGDGPSNRYALICKHCANHNGMALKEEFEYLSFKCCYCQSFNPARKKKPSAPKLEFETLTPPSIKRGFVSSSSDSESDSKPIITELRSDSPDVGKLSDFDKLSDIEQKQSDVETTEKMDVDTSNQDNDAEVARDIKEEPEELIDNQGMSVEDTKAEIKD